MTTQIDLLKKYGIRVRGHLGQHLLLDANISKKIIGLLDLKSGDTVLEIGPGLGSLTWHLLEQPIRLIAVEKDARFADALQKEFECRSSEGAVSASEAHWIHADILELDLHECFKKTGTRGPVKVVSNLPYYITAPILFKLIDHQALVSRAVLMMQKEVARRLAARPGTEDYGRLTLGVQYAAEVKSAMDVPASCFMPRPEVGSSVVVLDFLRKEKKSDSRDRLFSELVKLAFSQRRKTLAGLLAQSARIKNKQEALKLLSATGLPADVRGEKLSLKDFLNLTDNLLMSVKA